LLEKILKYFKNLEQTSTLKELATSLGVETSALQGMLDLLVKKGKLATSYQPASGGGCQGQSTACISCPAKKKKGGRSLKYYYLSR